MASPIPKRTSQTRRANKPTIDPVFGAAWPAPGDLPVPDDYDLPEPDENWHPIAKRFYAGALRSGQCYYYEASDYELLYMVCESISRDLKPQVVGMDPETGELKRARIPLKGTSLNAYMKAMGDLLITEGSRRRIRVELVRGITNEEDPKIKSIQSLKDRLAG